MIRSLRLRLLIGTSLATTVALSLLGIGIYYSMRRTLLSEFDEALLTQARALASMTEQERDTVKFEFDAQQMPEFSAKNDPQYFEIWLDGAGVVGRSDSLSQTDLPRPSPGSAVSFQDAKLPNGKRGRWVSMTFTPLIDEPVRPSAPSRTAIVTVARETRVLNHTLEQMQGLLIGLCSAAILVCGAVLMAVVGGALHPVRRLARFIEHFDETDLAHRFDLAGVPSELAPMVDRLNGLLERLQATFTRERTFTADVAHELRTPLAGLRTTLEVCRSRPRDTAAYEKALDKCIAITEWTQEMVQRLLLLARADARQITVRSQSMELHQLLEDSWAQFRPRADPRNLKMDLGSPGPFWVQTDADLLRIVIDNLFDNAVCYTPDGGNISADISAAINPNDQFVALVVSNTGSQVDAADVPKVFDRFWRGDQARSDTGIHCGLGLSLCERLMQILGGRLTVESQRGGLFVVRLQLIASSKPPFSRQTVC